jgi:hypothetical protein
MTEHPAVRIFVALTVGAIAAGIVAGLSYGLHMAHVWPGALVAAGVSSLCNIVASRTRTRDLR